MQERPRFPSLAIIPVRGRGPGPGRPRSSWHADPDILRDLYEVQGLSLKAVARALKISKARASLELKHHRIPIRSFPIQIDAAVLRELYQDQLTLKAIANRLGISGKTLSRELARHGIPIRSFKIQIDAAVLRELYQDQRLTLKAIANRLGISVPTLSRELARHDQGPMTNDE